MEVHQFHPSFAYGDAIGNEMVELKKTLKMWGYKSDIYTQYKGPNGSISKNYKEYLKNSSPNNILIIHYSIGYDEEVLSFIKSLPDKKFLIYHNITSPEYFTNINSQYEYYTKIGREQVRSLSKIVDYAVGDSEYNRQELGEFGFNNTGVLPILVDFIKYGVAHTNSIKKIDNSTKILFVGRISPNKKQDDIIKIFYYYKKNIDPNSKLYLVGSYEGLEKYYDMLLDLVKSLKLDDVYFTGKVDFDELISCYKSADVFLCMSEHEGFCVPLIESMFFDIPIIAFNSTAIPYTLGNSGILINKKEYKEIAELMHIIIEDKKTKGKIIRTQRDRLRDFNRESIEQIFRTQLDNLTNDKIEPKTTIRVEGTFEDSYSLSIINRNLALALDAIPVCDVSLYATTGTGDYTSNLKSLKDAKVIDLYKKKFYEPDFVIRNIYPPRINDMGGKNRLIYFYWEESRIPQQWVHEFNKLDAILAPSIFVKNVLIDSGVKTHIFVVPNGLNHGLLNINPRKLINITTQKKYTFLNISSGFPRKGIDILLDAFCEEFNKNNDVCLIIKTFPNIHNKVSELIHAAKAKNSNCPEIIHIDRDLNESEIVYLYKYSDCLVYPTRGEGFGLPIAEAMLFKIPVIATNYSAHLDFCNNDNSFLINYNLEPSRTHLKKEWNIENSLWAEPDKEHLKSLMRFVYENKTSEIIKNKSEKGYDAVNKLTWKNTADNVQKVLGVLEKKTNFKVGMVSTFNTKCGIAEYTKFLIESLENRVDIEVLANYENVDDIGINGFKVVRCWNKYQDDLEDLYKQITNDKLNVVHFQFNFGFFKLKILMNLIKKLNGDNVKSILTFHSVEDAYVFGEKIRLSDFKDDLKFVDRIWVHTCRDVGYLSKIDIVKNVVCIPQGIKKFSDNNENIIIGPIFNNSVIISSFGFLLPHKGVLEIIESLPALLKMYPDILFLAVNAIYSDDISKEYFEKCNLRVKRLGLEKNVIFFTEYLIDEEVIELLRLSDLVVMPYKDTKESSSAAIRFALSSNRPVIVTKLSIFDEFKDELYKIEMCNPQQIVNGVIDLLENKQLQAKLMTNSQKIVEGQSWANIAKIYNKMILEIV